jgi:hypothetical protein
MVDASRIGNLSSQAIEYLRLRLSVEKTPSNDVEFEKIGEIDKMITHMRNRLSASSGQQHKDIVDHRFESALSQKRNCPFNICGLNG